MKPRRTPSLTLAVGFSVVGAFINPSFPGWMMSLVMLAWAVVFLFLHLSGVDEQPPQ